ncbi:MAG: tetratricopeptide repeat protein [Opitutaceae bacterium]
MKFPSPAPCRFRLLLALALFGLAAHAADPAPARSTGAEEISAAELLKSLLLTRDQLHAAQLSAVNARLEAETRSRQESEALNAKLEGLRSAMETERAAQRAELQRTQAERERERLEMERNYRTLLWGVGGLAAAGLLVVLVSPWLQLRAINRLHDSALARAQLPAPKPTGLLTPGIEAGPAEQVVNSSNQRLLSMVDRIERRINALEQAATPAVGAGPVSSTTNLVAETDAARRASDQSAWVGVLLAKAQGLLKANRAQEALNCLEEILKLDPNHAEAWVKKGSALERLRQDEGAVRCYDRAIELNPGLTLAYLLKGGVCNRLKRFDEAVTCYEEALKVEETGRRNPAVARS